jgi:hypothetical protein
MSDNHFLIYQRYIIYEKLSQFSAHGARSCRMRLHEAPYCIKYVATYIFNLKPCSFDTRYVFEDYRNGRPESVFSLKVPSDL